MGKQVAEAVFQRLYNLFSRCQTEEIILSLPGKKLESVQDGAVTGRKLLEHMRVSVNMCESGFLRGCVLDRI